MTTHRPAQDLLPTPATGKGARRSGKHNLYSAINETKFQRKIRHDIDKYDPDTADFSLYTKEELSALDDAGVSDRLPPRATEYYLNLAKKSAPIANLIKARAEETEDLSGEADPSNQLKYSPTEGVLHKYELILLYVVRTCSSRCRYCYRSDFLTNKTEKDIADPALVANYVREHNARVRGADTLRLDAPRTMPIREALLSGGDPMVLSNRNLFDYMHALADAGVDLIRIGTKELAFFPERFDDNFFAMLDLFHELHPDVFIAFMVHFTHPDEFLELDDHAGGYVENARGRPKRIPAVEKAVRRLRSRPFVTLENQTPIISDVNDDPDALRLMQHELKRMGVNNHYFFQCREIEGHRAFAVPVEEAFSIFRDSQQGLSGIERCRFSLSTEAGKLEVVSLIDPIEDPADIPAGLPDHIADAFRDGLIIFKIHRAANPGRLSDIIIARRNPEALWITGYEDRIVYDGRVDGDERLATAMAAITTA